MARIITPKGKLGFISLREAQGFKGAEENKKYTAQLSVSGEEGREFIALLEKEFAALHATEVERLKGLGKNTRFAAPVVQFKEPTPGTFQFNFSRKESDGAPLLIDGEGKALQGGIEKGSYAKISFDLAPWLLPTGTFGITLRIEAVNILGGMTLSEAANLFGIVAKEGTDTTSTAAAAQHIVASRAELKDLF